MNRRKPLQKALSGSRNLRFGFRWSRTSGSHHIYAHRDVPELINLQNVRGQAKPYQVRQFLKIVERYNLALDEDQ